MVCVADFELALKKMAMLRFVQGSSLMIVSAVLTAERVEAYFSIFSSGMRETRSRLRGGDDDGSAIVKLQRFTREAAGSW